MLWGGEPMRETRRQSLSSGVQGCPEFQGSRGHIGKFLFVLNIKAHMQTKQKSPDRHYVPMIILVSVLGQDWT